MKIFSIIFLITLLNVASLFAQKEQQLRIFQHKLETCQLSWLQPLDSDYKITTSPLSDIQKYDLSIRSRKEQIEIRYFIEPYRAKQQLEDFPNLKFMRQVMHLATNDEEGLTAVHEVPPSDLVEAFQADWGQFAFFEPKASFSTRKHCKLLCIHKKEVGTAYVYFLFDEPSLALDSRFYALQFL